MTELTRRARRVSKRNFIRVAFRIILVFAVVTVLIGIGIIRSFSKDYSSDPLHDWFDHLGSGKGICCSVSDGRTVADPDYGTEGGHYWVIIDGKKYVVPDEALVTVPNKFGQAVVWPYLDYQGVMQIRCFMAGAGG
jgi:hypothetical protein